LRSIPRERWRFPPGIACSSSAIIAVARCSESDADSYECPLSDDDDDDDDDDDENDESAPVAGDLLANDSARSAHCSSLLLNYSLRNVASRGVIVGQLYRNARARARARLPV